MELLKSVVEGLIGLAKSPVLTATTALACAAMLFLPEGLQRSLHIERFGVDYAQWLGVALLISAIHLAVLACTSLVDVIGQVIGWIRLRRLRVEAIEALTYEEAQRIVPFLLHGQSVLHIDMTDGVASRLRSLGILRAYSGHINILRGVPHSLAPWARKALQSRKAQFSEVEPYEYRGW